jgi:hypothetical protein
MPAYQTATHDVGKISLKVSNSGSFGIISSTALGCEYPKGSKVQYLFSGGLWIGAVVKHDTLVSTGDDGWQVELEMAPDVSPKGEIVRRSLLDPDSPEYVGAVSEQDFLCTYTDTFLGNEDFNIPWDPFRGGPHVPLQVEITQKSYAWSYVYAEDFVLFDLSIKNIGTAKLEEVFVGLYIDADAGSRRLMNLDDVCGFLRAYRSWQGCGFEDTVNIAWSADNDGDPVDGQWADYHGSARAITGIRIIQPPSPYLDLSYNWWISNMNPTYDFGPRHKENYRDFRTGGTGTPIGDANKYYQMQNREFDYDQVYTAGIKDWDLTWKCPNPDLADSFASGFDNRFLLSWGAFNLDPGATLPLCFAYVAGENFHHDVGNGGNLPDHPDRYYANVDFSDLAKNAVWAEWIYDNPGVDTDGDGFAGDKRICVLDSSLTDTGWVVTAAETIYYRGDGIPDWRGAAPPTRPQFWLEPTVNGIRVRFNGQYTETDKDIFLNMVDFEGYRIYLGRDDRRESMSLVASYDLEDYDKYVWNGDLQPNGDFEMTDIPYTLTALRCAYSLMADPCHDSTFDPLAFTRQTPYRHPVYPDSVMYFVPHDYNVYRLGITTPIRKVYPDEPQPSPYDIPDPDRLTPEGYLKYYEYECQIENLLPTVPYWVNVTAFDFGSPKSGLMSLENSVTDSLKSLHPFGSSQAAGRLSKVYVYPNPYRINACYRANGFEGRTQEDRCDDRVRAIHFVNLPAICRIRIFTLDGDLVRELRHEMDPADPNHGYDHWGLITRNGQLVKSGLYYWTVESDDGPVQMGTFAIIM